MIRASGSQGVASSWRIDVIEHENTVMTTAVDYDQIIREASERLGAKFPDHSEAEVHAIVEEELAKLRNGTVQDYLSVLTIRAAQKRIKSQPDKA